MAKSSNKVYGFMHNGLYCVQHGGVIMWYRDEETYKQQLKAFEDYENSEEWKEEEYKRWFGERQKELKNKA